MKRLRRRRAAPALPNSRRAPAVAGLLLLTACAGACGTQAKVTRSPSPSLSASATAPGSPSPSPAVASANPTPVPSVVGPSSSRRPGSSPTPARPTPTPTSPAAPTGPSVAVPKPGTYTYALTGTTQTPLLGLQGPYAAGAVLTVDMSPASPVAGGTEVVQRTTSQPDGVVATTRSVWAAAAVRLAFSNVTFSGLSSYDCAYTPPPEVLPSPLTVVTLGEQSWTGPQCSGTLSVAVLDAETVTAAGRTWNAWRVHSVLHYRAQSALDVTMDTTSLLSPDLGTLVTGDATSTGTVAGQHFANHQITSLTSYP